jgi:hypothetical protein
VSVFFYHETFTRPQRLQCCLSMMTGLLAINAAVHSYPGYAVEKKDFFVSGVLSGLLVFPVFCGLVVMFNMRPAQVKKRMIKRAYSTREVDIINEQRAKMAAMSSLEPPAGYYKGPMLPVMGAQGHTNLLNIPAPLPLPPIPGGVGGLHALPPRRNAFVS